MGVAPNSEWDFNTAVLLGAAIGMTFGGIIAVKWG